MGLIGGAARIDERNPLRFALRDFQIRVANTGEKRTVLAFKTALVERLWAPVPVSAAGTLEARGEVGVHQDGEIRLQGSAQDAMEIENRRST